MPWNSIKVVGLADSHSRGNFHILSHHLIFSFDTVFWGFLRGGCFSIALALIFSNLMIGNPFGPHEIISWYSLDIFGGLP